MAHNLAGLKIRSQRKTKGLTQRELAGRAGISASYLNLVELNKRPASSALLDRIADGLGVERALLDGEAERRTIGALDEIAADPVLAEGMPSPGSAEELVSRLPQWARLLQKLYQVHLDEKQAVLALADRLNRDPFLGDSVHRMLTNVTAIRSATGILQSSEALEEKDRKRFMAIIASDSGKLSNTARALLAFFDNANMRVRSATPMEHVDAFIFEEDNHFPVLEEIAADFLKKCRPGEMPEAVATRLLENG
ncbi:MAG TPA: helix-turn-helix transcriptional regulator, partial [Hyphomicrobiales bacterium]|nr:helix-turn-helix transcriptional regulator [Hyphomicrobiales bacterium]